ncbi:hypothetical protein J4232_04525 [Candidatus Woesearchaeota archaeon]|nr:hypothetical protein [Candidatus Woesearchaeota archaeon]
MEQDRRLDNRVIALMRQQIYVLSPSFYREEPNFSKFNILLVDDSPDIINSLSTYLSVLETFSVAATASPYIAKELIKSYKGDEISITPEALIARAIIEMDESKKKGKLADKDYNLYKKADLLLPEGKVLSQIYHEGIVLIVSDAKMGGINGFQLLDFAAQEIPDTFRLILSAEPGFTQQRNPEELFKACAIGYINKGISDYETTLVAKIKSVFGDEIFARNLSEFAKYYRKHVNTF